MTDLIERHYTVAGDDPRPLRRRGDREVGRERRARRPNTGLLPSFAYDVCLISGGRSGFLNPLVAGDAAARSGVLAMSSALRLRSLARPEATPPVPDPLD